MMKSKLTIAALVVAGLTASPFAVSAKTKHVKHHTSSSMGSSSTTGANMKSSPGGSMGMSGGSMGNARGNTSSEGNVGPGTTNNNGPTPGGR